MFYLGLSILTAVCILAFIIILVVSKKLIYVEPPPKQYINELAEQWLQALESGKYNQTQNYLKTSEGHCCLGVACEVAGLHEELVPNEPGDHPQNPVPDQVTQFVFDKRTYSSAHTQKLPDGFLIELGLKSDIGAVSFTHGNEIEIGGERHDTLTGANDGGASFQDIAIALRKHSHLFFHDFERQAELKAKAASA